MKLTRRHAMATLAAAPLLLPRAGQAAGPPAALIKWMTLSGHFYMAPLVAQDTGQFTKQGLDVQVTISTAPPTLLPAVVSGTLQVGVSTGVQVALAREAGLDIVVLAGASVQERGHPTALLVVRPDLTIHSAADLIGKKVVSPGANGTFYLMFQKYLMDHGVDPRKVTMLEAGFAQMADMLRSGQADAVLAAEPYTTRLLDAKLGKPVEYYAIEREVVFDSFYICSQGWATANHDSMEKCRQALRDAVALMATDVARSAAIEAKYTKLPPDMIARLGVAAAKVDVTPADMKVWLDVGHQTGLLTQNPDPASLIAK